MGLKFEISVILPASPEKIYNAWLDSQGHAQMTGSPAQTSSAIGGKFEAWDGYIHGTNLELVPDKRIVQSWRTTEFDESDADSRIEVTLENTDEGTRLTIKHTDLPPHGMQYKQGWIDYYFDPMKEYFQS
ncbi:MAG: hypothetical protein GTO40_05550 [Deltaproteobacteria bacterium]|nr:hypothetical protein [Deltaproteobacteria bacterium]